MTAQPDGHEAPPGLDVEVLASRILFVFPTLTPESQRVAVHLYRLLEGGQPVSGNALAEAAG